MLEIPSLKITIDSLGLIYDDIILYIIGLSVAFKVLL